MGAPLILDDNCAPDGVVTAAHGHMAVERWRVVVLPTDGGRVALVLDHQYRALSSDGWKTARASRHELSIVQARHLGELLDQAARRAELASPPPPPAPLNRSPGP